MENGPYILVDYMNFKHEGTDPKERYKGKGWGLCQVLHEMISLEEHLPLDRKFAMAAKKVLLERIANSSDKEIEITRLPGWLNRLSTYFAEK